MKESKVWCYYCTQRPACPGAIPRGVVGIEDMDPEYPVEGIGKGSYSLVKYDRELTQHEMHEYELTFAYTEITG